MDNYNNTPNQHCCFILIPSKIKKKNPNQPNKKTTHVREQ